MRAIVAVVLFQGTELHWGCMWCPSEGWWWAHLVSCVGLGAAAAPSSVLHGGGAQVIDRSFSSEMWMACSRYSPPNQDSGLAFISDFSVTEKLEPFNFEPQLKCEALKNQGPCISVIFLFIYINFKTSLIPVFCPACFKKCTFTKAHRRSLPLYSIWPRFHKIHSW